MMVVVPDIGQGFARCLIDISWRWRQLATNLKNASRSRTRRPRAASITTANCWSLSEIILSGRPIPRVSRVSRAAVYITALIQPIFFAQLLRTRLCVVTTSA